MPLEYNYEKSKKKKKTTMNWSQLVTIKMGVVRVTLLTNENC